MRKMPVLLLVCIMVSFFALQLQAAPLESSGLLDSITQTYFNTANLWKGKLVFYASWLFWSLALLSMVWTFGMLLMKNAGLSEVLAEIIRFLVVTSFFWWLLINGPAIASSIILSMQKMAAEASGVGKTLTPSGIVDVGFNVVIEVVKRTSFWSPLDSLVNLFVALIVLVVLALVGINMLLLLISGWILIYGGIFLLGFGGGNWTSDIAISYYKAVLGLAVQIFTMVLLVGIGQSFVTQGYDALHSGSISLQDLAVMMVASIVLLVLTNKVPPMVASIIGSGFSSTGIGNLGASSAMTGAAVAEAAASRVGSAVAAGATAAAGGASALHAAFQQAQQHMAEGSGMFSGRPSKSSSGGSSGFMEAMGTTVNFAADMGKNLTQGAGAVAAHKVSTMMDTAKDKVSSTTGGKIAEAIKTAGSLAQNQPMRSQTSQDNFTGDSLGRGQQGNTLDTTQEEIMQFVNKNTPPV